MKTEEKPEVICEDGVASQVLIAPNGDLYGSDSHGIYQLDSALSSVVDSFVESRDVEELLALQAVLYRCHRTVKQAIERSRRQAFRDGRSPFRDGRLAP